MNTKCHVLEYKGDDLWEEIGEVVCSEKQDPLWLASLALMPWWPSLMDEVFTAPTVRSY